MKMAAVEDTWENSAEKKNWMGKVDNALLDSALDALWKIELQEREIDFMDGHRVNIKELVAEYLKEHPDKRFVGVAHMANRRKHVVVDGPHSAFWKDSSTADWKETPTGLGTFNNIFPDAASYLRFDEDPDHYCLLAGIIEVGSANNLRRIDFTDINGLSGARMTVGPRSILGDLRITRWNPAIKLRTTGSIRLDMEFETAVDVEILPLAVHVFPQEIANAADLSAYVTET